MITRIRYKIKEHTDEGRLITPMSRGQYDYSDSPMFDDYRGYTTVEEAYEAVTRFEKQQGHQVWENLVVLPFVLRD